MKTEYFREMENYIVNDKNLTQDKGSENANIRAKHARTGISCERIAKSGDDVISDNIIQE